MIKITLFLLTSELTFGSTPNFENMCLPPSDFELVYKGLSVSHRVAQNLNQLKDSEYALKLKGSDGLELCTLISDLLQESIITSQVENVEIDHGFWFKNSNFEMVLSRYYFQITIAPSTYTFSALHTDNHVKAKLENSILRSCLQDTQCVASFESIL